jgi:hypothetical protein
MGRAPTANELQSWAGQLDGGLTRDAFVSSLDHSDEYYATIIRPAYATYLGREADAAGINHWTNKMRAGLTDERLEAQFIGSDEFYANAGGTDQGWIDALYLRLLGRPADAAGEAHWLAALAGGEQRSAVAFRFTGSLERETQRIQEDYFHYLISAEAPIRRASITGSTSSPTVRRTKTRSPASSPRMSTSPRIRVDW